VTRLSHLAQGKRALVSTSWPANPDMGRPEPLPIALQALSVAELLEAAAAAREVFGAAHLSHNDAAFADTFTAELAIQILARACRDARNPGLTFAVDVEDIRRNTVHEECAQVFEQWKTLQARVNPGPYAGVTSRELIELGLPVLSQAEYDAVREAVKKKDGASLRAFGLDTLVSFTITSGSPPST